MYCICCKKNKITPYDPLMDGQLGEPKTEEELLWKDEVKNVNDGIIQTIGAGFGSIHDTDTFIIAICDECITENLEDGTLLLFRSGDYIDGDKHIDKSKKAYRRRKNLDGLVGEE